MNISTRDLQARLLALGFNPGPIDGLWGPRTKGARDEALEKFGGIKNGDLFHTTGIHRVHWHWTAGAYGIINVEHRSYNILINADGTDVEGQFPVEAQANYQVGKAASHTLNANSLAVGVSVDCMAGARERPFDPGSAPMTWEHVKGLVRVTAALCERFWIPVSRYSTLSHAEVQPTLGIRQSNKWDITWLPDMDRPGDPIEVGDRLRAMVEAEIAESGAQDEAVGACLAPEPA